MKVIAYATRVQGWWAVEVPDFDGLATQTRRLDQIADQVRDAAHLLGNIDPVTIDVEVVPQVAHADDARVARALADDARCQEQAKAAMRSAARELVADGIPMRDVAYLLDVSVQRARKFAHIDAAGVAKSGR